MNRGSLEKYSVVKQRISPLISFFSAIFGPEMLVYKQTDYVCVGDLKNKQTKSRFVSTAGNKEGERKKL